MHENLEVMSREEWQSIHDKYNSCVLSMAMGYKHGRLTSTQLMDLIEGYCETAYKLGFNKGIKEK